MFWKHGEPKRPPSSPPVRSMRRPDRPERLRLVAPYSIVEHVNALRGDDEMTTLEALELLATAEAYRQVQGSSKPVCPAPAAQQDRRRLVADLIGRFSTNEAARLSHLPRTTFFRIARKIRAKATKVPLLEVEA